jgi:maltooligosyltrehalose synthase
MAPIPVVEDYYAVFQVEQTCAPELISKAYKRLAKELHPDRNSRPDTTQAFQQVCQPFVAKAVESVVLTKSVIARWSLRNIE